MSGQLYIKEKLLGSRKRQICSELCQQTTRRRRRCAAPAGQGLRAVQAPMVIGLDDTTRAPPDYPVADYRVSRSDCPLRHTADGQLGVSHSTAENEKGLHGFAWQVTACYGNDPGMAREDRATHLTLGTNSCDRDHPALRCVVQGKLQVAFTPAGGQ
jgi:hypothetical protein